MAGTGKIYIGNRHLDNLTLTWQVRHVVSSMLGHVSHTRVLEAVLADPGANEMSNWAELRRLLGEIIDTFRWSSFLVLPISVYIL